MVRHSLLFSLVIVTGARAEGQTVTGLVLDIENNQCEKFHKDRPESSRSCESTCTSSARSVRLNTEVVDAGGSDSQCKTLAGFAPSYHYTAYEDCVSEQYYTKLREAVEAYMDAENCKELEQEGLKWVYAMVEKTPTADELALADGESDTPCFDRDSTTVCRLADASVTPKAAFEQCFGDVQGSLAERIQMKDLIAGDVVLSSKTEATRVIVTQHTSSSAVSSMVHIQHATGRLTLTPDHVLKIDGVFQPAREAKIGAALEPASTVTAVERTQAGIINPLTTNGRILAAGRAGAPVEASVYPEWIHELMQDKTSAYVRFSPTNLASYLFPEHVQAFYDAHLDAMFSTTAPALKVLKAAAPDAVAMALIFAFDAALVSGFVIHSFAGPKALAAVLAIAVAAKARRTAK
jgi:hypothetical protein